MTHAFLPIPEDGPEPAGTSSPCLGAQRVSRRIAWRPTRLTAGGWAWLLPIERIERYSTPDREPGAHGAWRIIAVRVARPRVYLVMESGYDHAAVQGVFLRQRAAIRYADDLRTIRATEDPGLSVTVRPWILGAPRSWLAGAWAATVDTSGVLKGIEGCTAMMPTEPPRDMDWVVSPGREHDWHERDARGMYGGLEYGDFVQAFGATPAEAERKARATMRARGPLPDHVLAAQAERRLREAAEHLELERAFLADHPQYAGLPGYNGPACSPQVSNTDGADSVVSEG